MLSKKFYEFWKENIKNSLVSNIQCLDEIFKEEVDNIDLIFRITYKVSVINYYFNVLKALFKIETVITEANFKKRSNITISKRLQASEIIKTNF